MDPPVPVAFGESLLLQVYDALGADPVRWKKTLLIVTHDEHGGFFDHVLPLNVAQPPGAQWATATAFTTTGPRVPAFVVSPFVSQAIVSSVTLDHTSILQLLAERFGAPGENYSPQVDARRAAGIGSISAVLDAKAQRPSPYAAPPDVTIPVQTELQVTRDPKTAE